MGTHNGETTISTFEFFNMFPSEDIAIEYFEYLRWGRVCELGPKNWTTS